MSKVISFRVDDEVYDFFKNLEKPFSESIPPLLLDYMNKMQNNACIHPVYNNKNDYKYKDIKNIDEKVDRLICNK